MCRDLCVPPLPTSSSASTSPHMAATMGNLWLCPECGKVCKSRGGLTRHAPVHKRHPRVGKLSDNIQRVYHPTFDGTTLDFFYTLTSSDLLKENHVVETASFFHWEHRQHPRLQNPMMIGCRLSHALDLSLWRCYIQRRHSQMTPSTNFSASGLRHWFPTTTLHR